MRKRLKTVWLVILASVVSLFLLLPMLWHSDGKPLNVSLPHHQTDKAYLTKIGPRVKDLSAFYGVKPSVVLGQIALASDYGKSLVSHRYHNLLGLEAQSGDDFADVTWQTMTDKGTQTSFRRVAVYSDWEVGVMAYLERLRQGEWGKELYDIMATTKDYQKVAKAIQASDWTTDKDYAKQLIKVIEDYQLTAYD